MLWRRPVGRTPGKHHTAVSLQTLNHSLRLTSMIQNHQLLITSCHFSQQMNSPTSSSITQPLEDLPPPPQSPTYSLPELPPIDYEAGNALPKPAQVNGFDHRKSGLITVEIFSTLFLHFLWTFWDFFLMVDLNLLYPTKYLTMRTSGMCCTAAERQCSVCTVYTTGLPQVLGRRSSFLLC